MSYTLKYTGPDIDDILDRAVEGGEIDEELELKAPLASPALTGEPTAPTQEEGDDSEKIATTAYADRAAAVAAYAAYPTDTALGAIASFSDGADNVPMKSVKVSIEPIQSGSGDPSPSNVRPIDGWEGATVTRAGANLFDGVWTQGDIDTSTGQETAGQSNRRRTGFMPVVPSSQIYVYAWNAANIRLYFYNENKGFISTSTYNGVVNVPATAYFIRLVTNETNAAGNIGINYPATVTTFVPYATSYPISWTGTVYGGTLDVTTGVLTVTHARVNLGSKNWNAATNNAYFWAAMQADAENPGAAGLAPDILCEAYPIANTVSNNAGAVALTSPALTYYVPTDYFRIIIKDTNYTDKDVLKADLDGVYLVYKLATPQTVQLDPITVSSLLGQNNLYADCGDVSVEYRADVALYIEKKLGGGVSTLSMAPSAQPAVVRPGLSLNLTEDEPELITEDEEPDLAEDAPEALEE